MSIKNIIICIKQVPDTNEVKIDEKTSTLIRDGVPSIMNPDDKSAVELGLSLKDKYPEIRITVITMGPSQSEVILREAMAMGCDKGVLISDRAFAGSDTWVTSSILAAAITNLGKFEIIMTGRQAIDGDTAQVGPQIAEKLGLPQVSYVNKVEYSKSSIVAHRHLEDKIEVVKANTPCLITVISDGNKPRYSRFPLVYWAYSQDINYIDNQILKLDEQEIGLKGSPTNVYKTFTPKMERSGVRIEEISKAAMLGLMEELSRKSIL